MHSRLTAAAKARAHQAVHRLPHHRGSVVHERGGRRGAAALAVASKATRRRRCMPQQPFQSPETPLPQACSRGCRRLGVCCTRSAGRDNIMMQLLQRRRTPPRMQASTPGNSRQQVLERNHRKQKGEKATRRQCCSATRMQQQQGQDDIQRVAAGSLHTLTLDAAHKHRGNHAMSSGA